jgi:hypothetical protein
MIGNQEQYTKHRNELGLIGSTRRAVQKALAAGRIKKLPNGRIDFEQADEDWERNTNQIQRRPRATKPIREELPDLSSLDCILNPERAAYRKLFDAILSRRNLVPGILAASGVKDPVLLHASDDLFATLILGLSGGREDVAYDWESDDIPPAETNIAAVFKKHGLKITPKIISAADLMLNAVDKAVSEVTGK